MVVTPRSQQCSEREVPRKRWTRVEVGLFEATGLWNNQHLELIDGELIDKMPKSRLHTNTLILVQAWLIQVFGVLFVNPETNIDVGPQDNATNNPEPDLIVLKRPSHEFAVSNPQPQDLHLVVEISQSTLEFDLTTKAALYARAGIPEYWVFHVKTRSLTVHRDPMDGSYRSVVEYGPSESVSPLAAPGSELLVNDAFPSVVI